MAEKFINQLIDGQVAILKQLKDLSENTEKRFAELKRDVGGLTTGVNDLKADVGGLKTDVNDLKTDVGGLKEKQDTFERKQDILVENAGNLMEGQTRIEKQLESFVRKKDLDYFDKKIGEHDRELYILKMES
ncbi:hypothetical protein [Gracilibacillus alcaliphilus]|uniref:hypothetical protein n=1 Tax=Gracilibacillus alcaliphilus TaxID=1401441 RepID=UPI0019594D1B|nr:hypothetical protein [Gracilibacillus alcaliphilus]MBM7678532.1 chromosome segregation ATPase [Gracilibacillus alcaliphilus]